MQKFYKDKSKLFECNISIEGANINEAKARLVLEFPNNRNLLFYGKIKENGRCEIPIPALKEFEETEGTVILEVIADSTYFESWRDDFVLRPNKKVTVEMIETNENIVEDKVKTPKVQVIAEKTTQAPKAPKKETDLSRFKNYITETYDNVDQIFRTKNLCVKLLKEYKSKERLSKSVVDNLVEQMNEQFRKTKQYL